VFFGSVGEKAEVADTHEAIGEHVEEKTADEFFGIEGHRFQPVFVSLKAKSGLDPLPPLPIYPRADRPVRDLLRKRSQLVRQRTTNLLSIQNLMTRNTGSSLNANRVKGLDVQQVDELLPHGDLALAVKANLSVMLSADEQTKILERTVIERVQLRPQFCFLKTVPGIGKILSLTIMLETGDIRRFASVGNYASYCRCVGSQKISNSKKKGQGNTKNGNKYLAWAFIEAANFAIRFSATINGFYQRKKAKTKGVVALKAVAHKLCRACYYIMRDQVPFNITKAFGQK